MIAIQEKIIKTRFVRLDASTVCQLKCPSCPTAMGKTGKNLGSGYLKFKDFKEFIDRNKEVSHIELSNWGEAFLNKDLVKILAYAYRHNVCIHIGNGVNLNHLREDVAEALVKYKVRRITCSIDGASQETYVQYRVKGDFNRVIENIKVINRWKAKHRSLYPQLKWQFIVFGHNEHEIAKARDMAASLGMSFYPKLSWGDLYGLPDFSPVKDKELVGKETGLGAASRKDFMAKYGQDYTERACCQELWTAPQINYDGRMLGCPINYWEDYGNVFEKGLDVCLKSEKMQYARDMLMGKREPVEGVPCTTCKVYHGIRRDRAWFTQNEIQGIHHNGRSYNMLANKVLGDAGAAYLGTAIYNLRKFLTSVKEGFKQAYMDICFMLGAMSSPEMRAASLPNQGYPLTIPLPSMGKDKWKAHFLFNGLTKQVRHITCHVSQLIHGYSPHPPHTHKEEEILMMLSGEADLLLPYYEGVEGKGRTRLRSGEFVYYPTGYLHTLQTASESPANYLMFKWYNPKPKADAKSLSFGKYRISDYFSGKNEPSGYQARTVFEGRTGYLMRLHCHTSILEPGVGYKPHFDRYDVAIIILEGEVESLGERFGPYSVLFSPSGQKHGMLNCGNIPAKYVVFEFER